MWNHQRNSRLLLDCQKSKSVECAAKRIHSSLWFHSAFSVPFCNLFVSIFRWSHMPQRSICCTVILQTQVYVKYFPFFEKLLCERNFIFMTFFCCFFVCLLSPFVCCASHLVCSIFNAQPKQTPMHINSHRTHTHIYKTDKVAQKGYFNRYRQYFNATRLNIFFISAQFVRLNCVRSFSVEQRKMQTCYFLLLLHYQQNCCTQKLKHFRSF